MTTVAHAVSAALVAVTAAGIAPGEIRYIVAALVAGAIADADHLYPVIRDWRYYRENGFRGNLHAARTPAHELPGLAAAGVIASLVWLLDPRMAFVLFAAFSIHLAQDFVMGRSLPFSPVDRTEVQMFAFSFRQKAAVDVLTILGSLALWATYLSGPR